MYLRKITLYVVAFVFLGLIGLNYAVSRVVLVRGLSKLEQQNTREHVNRAAGALSQRITNLSSIAHDWSSREEITAFMKNQPSPPQLSNFEDEIFLNLKISHLFLINNEGQVVYGKAFDLTQDKEVPLPRSFQQGLALNSALMQGPLKGKRVAGVFMLDGRPLLVAARPIGDKQKNSAPHGILLLGEYLDERLMQELSGLTQLKLDIQPFEATPASQDIHAIASQLSSQNPIRVRDLDENTIAGYTLINDISGEPALVMRVSSPRGMHIQVQRSIMFYLIAMALAGILSAVILLILLEKKILSRISLIIEKVEHIAKSGRITSRIPVEAGRNDELSKLAGSINHMLTALETSDKALMESEVKYRRVVERANDGIVITQERKLSYINPRMAAITGYSLSELQDAPLDMIIHHDDLARSYEIYAKGERGETTPDIVEVALQHKDGHIVPVEVNIGFIRYRGNPSALVIIRDIAERKKAEELLASEKERLSVTLRSIGEGVITTDTQMRIMLMSKAAERLTGWNQEEACGKILNEVLHLVREKTREQCDQPLSKIVSQGVMVELVNQTVLIAQDKSERIVAITGAPIRAMDGSVIGSVLVFRDITEKRRMEDELVKMQRMESVTTLAGSIAHDFNNILAGIIGNLSLARDLCGAQENLKTCIDEAEKASVRAKVLTQQLVTFSKGESPVKKRSALPDIIRDAADFALRSSNVRCEYDIADGLWLAEVDQPQISQVIHNLTTNAKQAMPEGGIMTISARNAIVDGQEHKPLTPGRYVHISVQDQGIGIPEENLTRVFEPFFTTNSKRLGLGLSTAYSIIGKHNGHILVHSKPGIKTTLDIFLPAALDQSKPHRMQEEQIAYGKGSILALEDDEGVRNLLGNTLHILGYDVTFAFDGNEAVHQYKEAMRKGDAFDLVIIDLQIPGGMGGEETIRDLLDYDPYAKAIVSSGNTTDAVIARYRDYGFQAAIRKPYKVAELSETIQKVLTEA